jgi:hypothetical protein
MHRYCQFATGVGVSGRIGEQIDEDLFQASGIGLLAL